MSDRLRFGIFMAPFHPAGENPTLALETRPELAERNMKAVEEMVAKHQAELAAG